MEAQFEAVVSDADSSLRCRYFACDDLTEDHAWHYHPEYELTWFLKGAGSRFVGDSIERYTSGDLVLIGPNLPHCWHNDVGHEAAELIFVQFDPGCLGADFLALPEAERISKLLHRADCGIHFKGEISQRVGERLRALAVQQGMTRLIGLLEVLNLLAEWPEYELLAATSYQSNNEINPMNRARIETVHQYVRANLAGHISQAEIASQIGLSAPAFSRFFRAAAGRTFVNFVNLLRVNQACRLLSGTKLSITTIALDCGYDNISNFNRQFLALKGMNPTEYRVHVQRMRGAPTTTELRQVS